jgi:hypothetical protein
VALLRASGIPARVVGGTTLNKQWKVSVDNGRHIVSSMGQGGHAWIEVFFPDLGWLSYDPQQSKQFTSSRHVKEAHGLDYTNIVDRWVGSPYAPGCTDTIDAQFLEDNVETRLVQTQNLPKGYLMSNQFTAQIQTVASVEPELRPDHGGPPVPERARPAEKPLPSPDRLGPPENLVKQPEPVIAEAPLPPERKETPEPVPAAPAPTAEPTIPPTAAEKAPAPPGKKPPVVGETRLPVVVEPERPTRPKREPLEFGNMEFPALVDTYRIVGNTGMKLLDSETAEYVTSQYVYAQAFRVDEPLTVQDISLAMHKFGGDGMIYIDLVTDDNGKPSSLRGYRSLPVSLERLERRPGYDWVTLAFPDDGGLPAVEKGKYWIVLRRSGDAVMTWFYIPGKSYSGPEDTRSTLKGYLWEDILTYDFVFRVRGVRKGG